MAESERVRLLREAYAAFNRGEFEQFLHLLSDEVEWRPPPTSLNPEPLQGREAVRAYLAPDLFDEQTAEPVEVIEEGDRILIAAQVRARGRGSGVELDEIVFHIWTIAGDRPVRFEVYLDREEALAAFTSSSS
jgi:ketosteroid isomerase-like protein